MEILIFSDSHGSVRGMREALERQLTPPDLVFFLGDGLRDVGALELDVGRVEAVAGNCDWLLSAGVQSCGTERLLDLRGHRLLLTHGHLYGVKGGYGALLTHAAAVGADVVLFGHTHRPHDEVIPAGTQLGEHRLARPLHLFNPGSIGQGGSFGTLTLRGSELLLGHGTL